MTLSLVRVVPALLLAAAFAGCIGGDAKSVDAPSARFTASAVEGSTFRFDASGTTGTVAEYVWAFGDGNTATTTTPTTEHTYGAKNANYTATLVAVGTTGLRGLAVQVVAVGTGVNNMPHGEIVEGPRWVRPGEKVSLDASALTDTDGDDFTYQWILGPYAQPEEASYDTGYLGEGENASRVFEAEGYYLFHCHPHPWMLFGLWVDPSAPAVGELQVDITGFGYEASTDRVPPGTKVTFTNLDPIPHTATMEMFAPGKVHSTGPVFEQNLEEGDWQVWLIAKDAGGAKHAQAWGLRASADAPRSPWNDIEAGPITLANGTKVHPMPALMHDARMRATLTWDATVPGTTMTLAMGELGYNPFLRADCDASKCTFPLTKVYKGEYSLRVSTNQASIEYTIDIDMVLLAKPGFGDVGGGGDGHAHHH
jgi:plastocyanin